VLCSRCRRQVAADARCCARCGFERRGASGGRPPLELVAPDGTAIPLLTELTIGRAPGNDVRIEDPSVSRQHARIAVAGDGVVTIADVASSHGTFLGGERVDQERVLHGGDAVQLGDSVLPVRVRSAAPGRGAHGVVPPVGASLIIPAIGAPTLEAAAARPAGRFPQLRDGHRIQHVDEDGSARWIVEHPASGNLVRIVGAEGRLLSQLDGRTPVAELVVSAERLLGVDGPAMLARLLADLGERGLLEGVDAPRRDAVPVTGWRRLAAPRRWGSARVGAAFDGLYARGGWLLFTRPALAAAATLAFVGFAAWLALLLGRYGTPFVVASHLGLGGLVFFISRLVLVTLHETAHGLTLASFGRSVPHAGLRVVLVFPYAYVETSESWFEPRRRRIAIALAGPASDLVVGGALALTCRFLSAGTIRDIVFQAALAAYVGAFFHLNPFLDRDGYHALVDLLERPRLRDRARAAFAARLAGVPGPVEPDVALRRYGIASLAWSALAAVIAIVFSLRYAPMLDQYAPSGVVWVVLATVWLVLLTPVLATVLPPLLARRRG
jgi:putative peptide zinc metalloprotease protein